MTSHPPSNPHPHTAPAAAPANAAQKATCSRRNLIRYALMGSLAMGATTTISGLADEIELNGHLGKDAKRASNVGNYLSGASLRNNLPGALESERMNGVRIKLKSKTMKALRAAMAYIESKGGHVEFEKDPVLCSYRTNLDQLHMAEQYASQRVGSVTNSFHLNGQAVHIINIFDKLPKTGEQVQDVMAKFGLMGGLSHGVCMDPFHFSMGEGSGNWAANAAAWKLCSNGRGQLREACATTGAAKWICGY